MTWSDWSSFVNAKFSIWLTMPHWIQITSWVYQTHGYLRNMIHYNFSNANQWNLAYKCTRKNNKNCEQTLFDWTNKLCPSWKRPSKEFRAENWNWKVVNWSFAWYFVKKACAAPTYAWKVHTHFWRFLFVKSLLENTTT